MEFFFGVDKLFMFVVIKSLFELFPGGNVNRTQKIFQDLYSNRRKIITVLIVIMLIPIFQNCGGSFSSGSSDAAGSGSNAGLGGGGTGGGGGTIIPTPTGGPTGPTLDQIQKQCKGLLIAPSLSAPSITAVTVSSGLGNANSGDQRAPTSINISSDRGISDAAKFTELNCNAQYSLQLRCEVLDTNAFPLSLTSAINTSGNNLLGGTATPLDLAKASFTNNNCQTGFGVGAGTAAFSIRPNTNAERCVEATFTVRLTVQSSITAQGNAFTSAPQYLSVHMSNGCWIETRLKDSAGNLPAVGNFGTAVAINGAWAAVVAPNDDAGPVVDVGSVYMYKYDGSAWNQKQKIQVSGAAARDTISSVAIEGDRLVIGSPSPYPGGQGNAYYYTAAGDVWTLARQISPPVSQADQAFGQRVGINAGQIFVAAPNFNSGGLSKSGAVYIYNSDGSGLAQTLTGAKAYVAFGTGLAVDGNTLAVGAPQAIGREAMGNGSVYVYTFGGSWSQAAMKSGSTVGETFGQSVALNGSHLAVGSPNFATGNNVAQGRVSVYDSYVSAADPVTFNGNATGDRFGLGLAASSQGIYMGNPGANGRVGSVDFYLHGDIAAKKLYFRHLAWNGNNNSDFGNAVAASGSDVVIGSRIKNDPNDNSGAAYIYRYK